MNLLKIEHNDENLQQFDCISCHISMIFWKKGLILLSHIVLEQGNSVILLNNSVITEFN